MYYQLKFQDDRCEVVNEFTYDELISHLATVRSYYSGVFGLTKKVCKVYEHFLQHQTLSLNNVTSERNCQIVEADSVADVLSEDYKIIDVRLFESDVSSCISPKYKMDKFEIARDRRCQRRRNYDMKRNHSKSYMYTVPSMVKSQYKIRANANDEYDEDIPAYVKIKPVRAKRNALCEKWEKVIVDENNWKSSKKKVRRQYMANKSDHRYTLKRNPYDMYDEYYQDDLLQEDFDFQEEIDRILSVG